MDDDTYSIFDDNLKNKLKQLALVVTSLDHRIDVQRISLREIQERVRRNREMIDNTPSIFPTNSIRFTSYFGMRTHPITLRRHYHAAVDLAGALGQEIFATADGEVIYSKRQEMLGNCIKIRHKYGYQTLYGHLKKIVAEVGDKVRKGDVIGTMGSSGRSSGVHLHYGISLNRKAQNPVKYFKN